PSVRLPEKLAKPTLRVFLRRGRQGLLSRAPVPRAVLLPESLRGLTPSAPVSDRSLPRSAFGPGESTPARAGAATGLRGRGPLYWPRGGEAPGRASSGFH